MTGREYEKPLHIDMDFEEALERFTGVDPAEIPDNKKLKRKKKGGTKPPSGVDGDSDPETGT